MGFLTSALRQRRLQGVCCFSWAVWWGAPAHADAPEADLAEVTEAAKARFDEGMQAFLEGRFLAAVEHFKEADRLAPSARLSYNVAIAYERMRNGPNALAAYREYLRRLPDAENAATTSVRIAELELELQKSGVQQVTVLSAPAGATVAIDGVSRGVTPWTGELPPGPHQLLLRARGHWDLTEDFELPARHAIDLLFNLESIDALAARAPLAVAAELAFPHPPEDWAAPVADASPGAAAAPGAPRWWTWPAFGASAALLADAGALELSRRGLERDAARADVQIDGKRSYDAMLDHQRMSRVLFGTGIALGVAGGISLYLDLQSSEPGAPALALSCQNGECSAVAWGAF